MGRWDDRLSVSAWSSRNLSLAQDLELYRRLAVDRIVLFFPKLVDHGLAEAVAVLESEVAGGRRVDGILPGCNFDLADPASWPEVRRTMIQALDVAARLGAPSLQLPGGRARGLLYEEAAARFVGAIEPVLEHARRHGQVVAIEPVRPQFAHIGFLHSLGDALELAGQLDLGLVLDTAHLWWEPGLLEGFRAAAPRCASLQVADLALDQPVLERLVPGDGQVPIPAMLAAAASGGFGGPFELELIGSAIEAEGYEGAIGRALAQVSSWLGRLPGG